MSLGQVQQISEGLYAYLQPDGSWFLNNTGFLVSPAGVISIDTTSTERRTRAVARPRQIAMWLCKQLTTRSLPDIGRRFGGRDHTTVLHAVRRIEELRAIEPPLAADVEALVRKLRG